MTRSARGAWTQATHIDASNAGAAYAFDLHAPSPPGTPYCQGQWFMRPCGNTSSGTLEGGHAGCANSAFASGAALTGSGSRSVAAADLVLSVDGAVPQSVGVLFAGEDALNQGYGVVVGNGLLCAGGSVLRFAVVPSDAGGHAASTGIDVASSTGAIPGVRRAYQYWYRDPVGSGCGHGFNFSNGYEVLWAP